MAHRVLPCLALSLAACSSTTRIENAFVGGYSVELAAGGVPLPVRVGIAGETGR